MKTKYYKYTLKGQHSAESAQSAVGGSESHGLVVRVDSASGQTNVYFASQGGISSGGKKASSTKGKKAAATGGAKFVEVSEKDITK